MKILAHYHDSTYTPQRRAAKTFGPLGYYRVVKPAEIAESLGHDVTIIGEDITKFGKNLEEEFNYIFQNYDVFWTGYFTDEKAATAIFYHAQKYHKKVIIDIDDDYLDLPLTNQMYDRFKQGKRERAFLGTILSFADVITVSTYPLKERIAAHLRSVYGMEKVIVVIPNQNELAFWETSEKPIFEKDQITIGYSGSNSHQDDLQMIIPAMAKLMEKYPNLYWKNIGAIQKDLIREYFRGWKDEWMDRVSVGACESVFKNYPAWVAQQPWDIAIAPLVDTAFTRCKSHIKWLEYSMYKVPTVASRVYPYHMPIDGVPIIEDGKTGLLAANNEWVEKLEMLITDTDLRKRMGQEAYDAVKMNWQYGDENIWGQRIKNMLENI